MKRFFPYCLLLLALLLFKTASFAQIHEFGVWGGMTNYFGDLNTKTSFKFARPGAGAFYRYNIKYRGAWKTSVNWGIATFDDSKTNIAFNRQRNLSFKTNIFDVTSVIEFNFLKFDKGVSHLRLNSLEIISRSFLFIVS